MFGIAFITPVALIGLFVLPLIWLLLRMIPPKPHEEIFPPLRLLQKLTKHQETPRKSPWWITALRIIMTAMAILALAGPILNPQSTVTIAKEGHVIVIVDDSWASRFSLGAQLNLAEQILQTASKSGLASGFASLSQAATSAFVGDDPARLMEKLATIRSQPVNLDINGTTKAITRDLQGQKAEVFFLSSGLRPQGWQEFVDILSAQNDWKLRVFQPEDLSLIAITNVENTNTTLNVTMTTLGDQPVGNLVAYDERSRIIGSTPLSNARPLDSGQLSIDLELPLELRNDIARIALQEKASVGATYLINVGSKRRRIAMLSGVSNDFAQPLLEPLHYISSALSPIADVQLAQEANLISEVSRLLAENPSIFVLADVGTLPQAATQSLVNFVNNGGTLLRFAGPRLAGGDFQDPLIPVLLRTGERTLDGTLSWDSSQSLSDFSKESPFYGISIEDDILIKRQVLAEPDAELGRKTWAQLTDNTPLVTAEKIGQGTVILFHVTADANWSNLPLSGTFVSMLNRIVELSQQSSTADGQIATQELVLPPFKILQADGTLTQPPNTVKPLIISAGTTVKTNLSNPPGQYGIKEGFKSLNLFDGTELTQRKLEPIDLQNTQPETYPDQQPYDLSAWFFTIAFIMLVADSLIMLVLRKKGAFFQLPRFQLPRSGISNLIVIIASAAIFTALHIPSTFAQNAATDDLEKLQKVLPAVYETRLAYVVTGDTNIDEISQAGLTGLSRFLTLRTAVEPGAPIGIDLSNDELAFFPLIYWPISANTSVPNAQTLSRLDAYMKNGGTVLFDTRNGLSSGFGRPSGQSPSEIRLADILADLDIPPLEPVPPDHVLTKAFYILNSFPGRFNNGQLWVESQPKLDESSINLPVRAADGVSSILISGNDLAGAWAITPSGRPLLPTASDDPNQRVMALRAGVNIVMYTLTGNYKSDQIHIPDLLERLGQ